MNAFEYLINQITGNLDMLRAVRILHNVKYYDGLMYYFANLITSLTFAP